MTGAATGITKIKKINNAGIFSAFAWPALPHELAFKKINLVYGYNGSGKTTLSNVIGLFSEDHHERDDLDKERIKQGLSADPSKPLEIEIEWDGKTVKYPIDRKKLYVFNSAFVADHVYDGTQAKVKNFKQVTTQEQLSNPALKKIEDAITAQTTKKDNAETYIKELETLFGNIKKALSKTWNENIEGKRMPSLDFSSPSQAASQDSEETIQKALEEEFSKFKASKDQEALEKAIADLNQILACAIRLPDNMGDIIQRQIAKTAREKVQAKIDALKIHALKHSSIQNWFEDGATLLKETQGQGKCPLCDSALPDLENLLASYDAYFNDELATLKREVGDVITALDGLITESQTKHTQVMRIEKILSDYGYKDMAGEAEKAAFSRLQDQAVKNPLNTVKSFFERKRDDIDFIPSTEDKAGIDSLSDVVSQFFTDIATLISLKNNTISRLQSARFDDKSAKAVCEGLFWKRFDIQGKKIAADAEKKETGLEIPDNLGGIAFLRFLKEAFQSAQAMILTKGKERADELSKLKTESKYVNAFLARLCISNFTINTTDDGEITVHYVGGQAKKGIQYSLSEGEKTALAFAYFLSKYRHEVIDNQQAKREDYTIVIDDPVSSLDENRLFSTALVIQDTMIPRATKTEKDQSGKTVVTEWEGCRQIIILSHNIIFLKFMGNLTDSNQNTSRSDLFLDKGRILFLPDALKNYQTSYFHKLEKIQAYYAGEISHDDVKDSLPNYIRVTLEAFISFKFARLIGKDKFTPAMFDYLIGHITSNAKAFDGFTAVSGITDSQSLKNTLLEIKQKTNPECHGTTQDITHIEYIPESELKKLAEQTLNVIQFLDQIHFQAAQKLQQAAA